MLKLVKQMVDFHFKMSTSFQERNQEIDAYPEQTYFRNSIVIGELPLDVNLSQFLNFIQDALMCKTDHQKLIIDLKHVNMKAVVLTYENEKLARLCAFRLSKVASCVHFTLYDGDTLFQHCKQLNQLCHPRSRNVLISDFDTSIPQEMYLDLVKVFGNIEYFEFCTEGEIPNARIEFTRATSAFACELFLQGALSKEALVTLEVSLFPIEPISSSKRCCQNIPLSENYPTVNVAGIQQFPTLNVFPMAIQQPQEEIREHYFMLCSMNSLNYPHSLEDTWADLGLLPTKGVNNQREAIEECSMETLSWEISRKRLQSKGVMMMRHLPFNFDKNKEESLKLFLRAINRKNLMPYKFICKEPLYSNCFF